MEKTIIFLMVFFLPLIGFSQSEVSGDEDNNVFFMSTPKDYELKKEKIVLNVTKDNYSFENSAFNVEVLETDDINSLPFSSTSEVLDFVPSVAMQRGGEFIQPSIPTIYGSDLSHTKVVVDGVELNSQLDGAVDMSIFQLSTIDRLEIATGPMSSLWGSSLGGVIFIKTKDPVEPGVSADISYGDNNMVRGSLETAFKLGSGSFIVIPQYTSTDGYMPQGESTREGCLLKSFFDLTDSFKMEFMANWNDADIQEYEQPRFGIRSELDSRNSFSGLKFIFDPFLSQDKLKADLFFNGFENKGERRRYLLDDTAIDPYDTTTFDENRMGVRGDISYQEDSYSVMLESNYDKSNLESNNFTGEKEVSSYYFSANYKGEITDNAYEQVFIRFDGNDAYNDETSYGIGMGLNDIYEWKINLTFSRDFNAPPLIYRYMDRPEFGLLSNPDLGAETAYTTNLAFEKIFFETLLFKLKVYYQEMDDGIILEADENSNYFYANHDSLKRQGVEATLACDIFESSVIRLGGAFNDVVSDETNEIIPDRVRLKYNLAFETDLTEKLKFDIIGYYYWWNMDSFYNAKDRNFVFDSKLSYKVNERGQIYLTCKNLFNTEQYWIDVYPNPERNFEAGVSLKF
ncbi:MAG: hypothetical protein ACD_79C01527G0017 [uncultured bacterium]|nr:MAG: hypothetical protein ACD_79C01527G0017 [uncultured bacterium]